MRMRAGPSLDHAKRRSSHRARESGAAMFVVAMTISVLASVGVYALAAAANEVATSGNERQNTQTHYLTELGAIAVAHFVTGPTADTYLNIMTNTPTTPCQALPNVPVTAPAQTRACRWIPSTELAQTWTTPTATLAYGGTTPAQPFSTGIAPGSFGTTPLNGDFYVELTDPSRAPPPPGYSVGTICATQLTATVSGFTQPVFAAAVAGSNISFEGEGLEVQRMRFIAQPVRCQ